MKTASAARVAAQFDIYLEASRTQPVLITRNGKPVAVLVAVLDKADAEQLAVRRTRSLRSVFEEAHAQLQKGGGIPHDEFWRQVAERRAKRRIALRRKRA
jgi:prevent-host-death family protein